MDNDGRHINCLLAAFFMAHLPQLIEMSKVFYVVAPLYKVTKGKEYKWLYKPEELAGYRGWDVVRMKGLGEMQADEMWESMMSPQTRTLIPIITENFKETAALVESIMGKKPGAKRSFIMERAKEYALTADGETAYDVEDE